MKKYLYIIISIIFFSTGIVSAQSPSFNEDDSNHSSESEADDPCIIQEKKLYSWRISPELGTRYEVPIDTTFLNYGDTDVEDCFTTAYNYLGNYGSPGESTLFFKRLERPDFRFMDSYHRFNVYPYKATF